MKILRYLKLIRLPNLLLIALIQYFVRFFIFSPSLAKAGVCLEFSDINFLLLVITTVLIAAGGYLINDYFDKERDKIDGRKVIIDNGVSSKQALNLYIIINIIAIAIAFYISFIVHFYKLAFIFLIIQGLLWFYSQSFKKSFLLGNLIVALLAAMVILILLPYEFLCQINVNGDFLTKTQNNLEELIKWTVAFSIFSFVFTLIREIIKDIEDIEADKSFNYKTLPIVTSVTVAKIIVSILSITLIGLYGTFIYSNMNISFNFALIYAIIFIILPLIYIAVQIFFCREQKDFRRLSLFSKIIIVTATIFLIFIF